MLKTDISALIQTSTVTCPAPLSSIKQFLLNASITRVQLHQFFLLLEVTPLKYPLSAFLHPAAIRLHERQRQQPYGGLQKGKHLVVLPTSTGLGELRIWPSDSTVPFVHSLQP